MRSILIHKRLWSLIHWLVERKQLVSVYMLVCVSFEIRCTDNISVAERCPLFDRGVGYGQREDCALLVSGPRECWLFIMSKFLWCATTASATLSSHT